MLPFFQVIRVNYRVTIMASLVIANGSGLISAILGAPNTFTVHTGRSGIGDLSVRVVGPSRSETSFSDNHDGSVKVTYTISKKGTYKIYITYDGVPVRRSPFTVPVRAAEPRRYLIGLSSATSPSCYSRSSRLIKVTGRGLNNGLTMISNEIIVDTSAAAPGRLTWTITGPGHVEYRQDLPKQGLHKLYYRPYKSGDYIIRIKYAERDVNGSPFNVMVM